MIAEDRVARGGIGCAEPHGITNSATCAVEVMERLHEMIGLPCCDFRLIVGGSLILYLGDRRSEQALTEWRLHLEPAWRLDGLTGPLVGSFDTCTEERPEDWIFAALRSLMGRKVENIVVGSPVLDLRIEFSGSQRLLSFSHDVAGGENWEFRHRSGRRLAMRSLTEFVEYFEEPD